MNAQRRSLTTAQVAVVQELENTGFIAMAAEAATQWGLGSPFLDGDQCPQTLRPHIDQINKEVLEAYLIATNQVPDQQIRLNLQPTAV